MGTFASSLLKPDPLHGPPVHDIDHLTGMMTGLPPQMKRKRANPDPKSWAACVGVEVLGPESDEE